MNSVYLNGRLTFQPELKTSATGRHYVYFTVANNEKTGKDGKSFSSFIRCIAWGKTAELICTVLSKGSRIWIDSGTLVASEYTDKEGVKRYDMKLQVYKFDYEAPRKAQEAGNVEGQGGWLDMGEEVEF